jgi:fatty aldehyde-generating acyl-ACP reductase
VGVGRFLRSYSCTDADYERKLAAIPAVVSSEVRFRSTSARGEVICINRLPELMTGPEARRDVVAAAHLAVSRGARVIGLGALTAPATGGGLTIIRDLPHNVTLTNGNALTAAIVFRNVADASRTLLGSSRRGAVVAIVGCTGSVGSSATRLLADAGYRLILIGRNHLRVERDFADLPTAVRSEHLGDIASADVVVLLTSDASARVTADLPKEGSVVIDCAQPANILRTSYSEFGRRGITVVEGGIVRIVGYSSTDDFGFSDHGDTFACLAETYVVARCGVREHSVGRRTAEDARRIERLAARCGVEARPLDFTCRPLANAMVC